jgi:hypothetical protein
MSCAVRGAVAPRRTRRKRSELAPSSVVDLALTMMPDPSKDVGQGTNMEREDKTIRLVVRIGARASLADGRTDDRVLADDIAGNAFTALLLHALRRPALGESFVDVLDHVMQAAMFAASTVDVRRLRDLDDRAFEPVELSPVVLATPRVTPSRLGA